MPKIWLPNVEEDADPLDIHYESLFLPKVLRTSVRYLILLQPEDIFISPAPVNRDFLEYIVRIKGLKKNQKEPDTQGIVFPLPKLSSPYSLADSIMQDQDLMDILKRLGHEGRWFLEPYMETPKIALLSRKTGIPLRGTDVNIIEGEITRKWNEKTFFRKIAQKLGMTPVRGYRAKHREEIEKYIKIVEKENHNGIILKKSRYAGGFGNLSGSGEWLLSRLSSWYNGGEVLVEHFLPLTETAGSLVEIKDKGCVFMGMDLQLIEKGQWAGFSYPYNSSRIETMSMQIAEEARQMGVRGYMNLDWGIVRSTNTSSSDSKIPQENLPPNTDSVSIFPLESNFRHNGLSCILDLGRDYFDSPVTHKKIFYYENLSVNNISFSSLLKIMKEIKIDGEEILINQAPPHKNPDKINPSSPRNGRGVILTTPPEIKKLGMAFFDFSLQEVDLIYNRLKEKI